MNVIQEIVEKHLHIIAPDIPYPVESGGVCDLFYKMQALQQQDVHIHLHCFGKEKIRMRQLEKYCFSINYYDCASATNFLFKRVPYVVCQRTSEDLLQNLLKDDHPVFMEGISCSWPVMDKRFAKRKKFIRMLHVEHDHCKQMQPFASGFQQRLFYKAEGYLLKKFEEKLVDKASGYWPASVSDTTFFKQRMHFKNMNCIPLFLPPWEIKTHYGRGVFCLYHGKLNSAENEHAALWLMTKVFNDIDVPFVIAGKDPGKKLLEKARQFPNTCVISNPSEKELDDMIFKAHIHVLPSFNTSSMKFKLLNALFNGRHCVVNENMVKNTGLNETCHVANNATEFKETIQRLYHQSFTKEDTGLRRKLLRQRYDNEAGAKQMIEYIWNS